MHTFSTVISDISEGYLKDFHASQQSSSFSVPNLPEYVQNIITAQANQQTQSSQFGFQQQQQQELDTLQQQNQFQQQCFFLQCDQTITGRNLEYSRQNHFSCEFPPGSSGKPKNNFFPSSSFFRTTKTLHLIKAK